MIFTELRFLVFFAIVLGVHWSLRRNRARKVWLLACSYVFYGAWDWRFLSLILASTVVDYFAGVRIASHPDEPDRRRHLLFMSLFCNLGLLGVFKYFNFFVDSGVAVLNTMGIQADPSILRIILPVGISFYTFQTMSYTIDVYRGRLTPTHDFLDLALFVGFFPQLVAGPIVRARDFLPQLVILRKRSDILFRPYVLLFLSGFFKKACVSDNISGIVDTYFSNPQSYDALSAWIGVMLYSVQIYCDFSGYSDMAIATAGFLGYTLCDNFAFPYFSGSIQEFWRRWHISLSTWLRDYLYIPLGGGRGATLFRYRNLMLTMLLGGLWHGAAWRFVIWGGLHGFALVVHREWRAALERGARRSPIPALLGMAMTYYWVGLTWIFFRSSDWKSAFVVAKAYVFLDGPGTNRLNPEALFLVAILALAHWVAYRRGAIAIWYRLPRPIFVTGIGVVVGVICTLIASDVRPFIYFQF